MNLKFKDESILLESVYQKLQASFLSTLLYCLGVCDEERNGIDIHAQGETESSSSAKESKQTTTDDSSNTKDTIFHIPKFSNNVTKSQFLSQLPHFWLQKLLKSDCLCVKNEFERYQLAKKVLKPNNVERFGGYGNKRKVGVEYEGDWNEVGESQDSSSTILETNSLTEKDENLFESSIIYTYMSFAELNIVKMDGLVPISLALESYWQQNELSIQKSQSTLPKYRFSYKFTNVSGATNDLLSPTFNCLSQLFRLMLTKEGGGYKALLQKSKGGGPISYCIYRIDLRGGQVEGTDSPVTYCTADDDGYATLIEDCAVLEDGEDSIRLVACIRFHQK